MRRKIPVRKHRGVKDLERRRIEQWASIKNKINHPPKDPDDQAVPRKVQELKLLIDKVKSKEYFKKRPSKIHKDKDLIDTAKFEGKTVNLPGMKIPEKAVPIFKQRPGESSGHFLHRINMKCQEVIHESQFENKFKVRVERNAETGRVENVSKLSKEELNLLKPVSASDDKEEKVSKACRKRMKIKEKLAEKNKKKIDMNVDEFSKYKDVVKFGETVHAPPQLDILPRNSNKDDSQKPGRRGLLLKDLMETNRETSKPSIFNETNKTKIGKKKSLPTAEQRILEAQRIQAVQAYRMLKSRKAVNAKNNKKSK